MPTKFGQKFPGNPEKENESQKSFTTKDIYKEVKKKQTLIIIIMNKQWRGSTTIIIFQEKMFLFSFLLNLYVRVLSWVYIYIQMLTHESLLF